MKINIEFEVSDDIIEEKVTEFCDEFDIEDITHDQRKAIISKICEAIEAELTGSAINDAVHYVDLDEIKFSLGKKTFESMLK